MRYARLALLLGVLAFVVVVLRPAPVEAAAIFTVDSRLDMADAIPGDGACDDGFGNCTVRAAIEQGNASADLRAQTEVSVIVSLREPPVLHAAPLEIAVLEAQVAESQQRVLSALAPDEFETSHRYRAVPALAGIATTTAMEKLAAHPEVMAVSLNREVRATLTESVPLINADDVHGLGYTGQGVVVAVLDTGLDTDHPDLQDDLLAEVCFLTAPDVCPSLPHPAEDGDGHGTNVTGIITGAGIVAPLGVAPDADIVAYKVLGDDGGGSFADVLAAADDIIADHPEVDIINMSLGDEEGHVPGSACDSLIPALTTTFAILVSNDVMIFAASGNEAFKSGISYPACMSDVTSVGMVYDRNGGPISWSGGCLDRSSAVDLVPCISNSHAELDLLAPGAGITATGLAGGTSTMAGTSQASPHAAAVAALVRQAAPLMSGASIVSTLKSTGVNVTDPANSVITPRVDALAAILPPPPPPATYTVDSTGDGGDSNTADGVCDDGLGACTLRAAIEQANANNAADTINFNIPGAGPHTISPGSALPAITAPVTVDGTSEPDFAGTPIIQLDGSGAGAGADGLRITDGSSTVKGLVINHFEDDGIELSGRGGNTIGGTAAGARNVISGNSENGIRITGGGAMGNLVQGNYIGTDVTGTVGLGDFGDGDGVYIYHAPGNTIGGTTAAERNVISGNSSNGVEITGGGAMGNLVQGNYIGTDVTGTADLGNWHGVYILSEASNNTVGGTAAGAGNLISGNTFEGVYFWFGTGNHVQGNLIGTDKDGTAALGNWHGVGIFAASSNTIGGTAPGAGNVISGNQFEGVDILSATGSQVQGNFIGTDVTGTAALSNGRNGVRLYGDATSNTIGGTTPDERNVISGNNHDGVRIWDNRATGNLVQGNYIGTDVTGTAALGNSYNGVRIDDAPGNTVGPGNVISGNEYGVYISGADATANTVRDNKIGTSAAGDAAIANGFSGVIIYGAPDNTIGPGNVISGNSDNGVRIWNSGATANTVRDNKIGTNAAGDAAIANGSDGVFIIDAPANTIGPGNVISGNSYAGVLIFISGATGNTVTGNSIHSNGGLGIDNASGGNTELTPPAVTAAGSASGTSSCLGCTVEVYSDAADEGKDFHGSTGTDVVTGDWSFAGAVVGPNVTATVTDSSGNTSEFSAPFVADTDGDGVPDSSDNCPDDANADQANADGDQWGDVCDDDDDNDGMPDGFELANSACGLDPLFDDGQVDADSDFLSNLTEFTEGTLPCDSDTDDDFLLDAEVLFGLDPLNPDTDGDGLIDAEALFGLDPLNPDSDGDGLSDGDEVNTYDTNPAAPDTDHDLVSDGDEIAFGSDPLDPDTDDDGILDILEIAVYGTDPADPDTDGDGLGDGVELLLGSDPLDPNSP
jgi:hypothetical protein